jgi:hypothetical protein
MKLHNLTDTANVLAVFACYNPVSDFEPSYVSSSKPSKIPNSLSAKIGATDLT